MFWVDASIICVVYSVILLFVVSSFIIYERFTVFDDIIYSVSFIEDFIPIVEISIFGIGSVVGMINSLFDVVIIIFGSVNCILLILDSITKEDVSIFDKVLLIINSVDFISGIKFTWVETLPHVVYSFCALRQSISHSSQVFVPLLLIIVPLGHSSKHSPLYINGDLSIQLKQLFSLGPLHVLHFEWQFSIILPFI